MRVSQVYFSIFVLFINSKAFASDAQLSPFVFSNSLECFGLLVLVGGVLFAFWKRKQALCSKESLEGLYEERFKLIFDQASVGIALVSTSGQWLMVNDYFCQIVGYDEEELLTMSFRDITHPSDVQYDSQLIEQINNNEISYYSREKRYVHKDGNSVWVDVNVTAARDERGKSKYVIAVIKELSVQKSYEKRIVIRENQLRTVFDNSLVGIFHFDSNGVVLDCNQQGAAILGAPVEAIKGFNVYTQHMNTDLIEGLKKAVAGISSNYEGLFTSMTGGRTAYIRATFNPVPSDSPSSEVIVTVDDITEQYETQTALQQSETIFKNIVESMPVMMDAVNDEGIFVFWNKECERVTGYSADDMIGNPRGLELIYPNPDDLARVMQSLDTSKDYTTGEFTLTAKDGTLKTARWSNFSASKTIPGWVAWGLGVDLTDRKAIESQLLQAKEVAEEAASMKAALLANVSHEIRTPIHAIMGLSHLTLQTKLTIQQKNYLGKIHASSKSLLRIINDLLAFTKADLGELSFDEIQFSLNDVLQTISNSLFLKAKEKHLDFTCQITPDTPNWLIGDPYRLEQVLTNLATNSIKFTEKGKVLISIAPSKTSGHNVELLFKVTDTGIGISEKQKKTIFLPFKQADNSIARKYGGTGLGLSISKEIVETLGGEIGVTSSLGEGATFWFKITYKIDKQFEASKELTKLKILIIDDKTTSQTDSFLNLLGEFSSEVVLTTSSLVYQKLLGEKMTPDLIIIDFETVELDVFSMTQKIRALQNTSFTPIVFLGSKRDHSKMMYQCNEVSLCRHLVKPACSFTLRNTISSVVAQTKKRTLERINQKAIQKKVRDRIGGAHILVAEDNDINSEIIVKLLLEVGLQATIATNGREAVDLARQHDFQAIIMDVQMPELDGLEATKILRAAKWFKDVPIIAMTAHAMESDRIKSIETGMNYHLTKPIDLNQMYKTLLQAIDSDNSTFLD